MSETNIIVGKNLMLLRKQKGLTQLQLAEQFNYSDKSISKWEKGEAMPSIDILKNLADFYKVSLDYLVEETHTEIQEEEKETKKQIINKYAISLLVISSVWIVATILFVQFNIWLSVNEWRFFVWAFPISFVLAVIFNSIWGRSRMTYIYVSCLVWSILAGLYYEFVTYNLWIIFTTGIPIQVAIYLTSKIKKKHHKK